MLSLESASLHKGDSAALNIKICGRKDSTSRSAFVLALLLLRTRCSIRTAGEVLNHLEIALRAVKVAILLQLRKGTRLTLELVKDGYYLDTILLKAIGKLTFFRMVWRTGAPKLQAKFLGG